MARRREDAVERTAALGWSLLSRGQQSSGAAHRLGVVAEAVRPNGSVTEHLRAEFDALAGRVQQQREQADRLRGLADQLEEQTAHDEHLLQELAAVLGLSAQLRLEDLSPRLRGRRLQEVAVEILRSRWGAKQDIHYREWYHLVQAEGHTIGGKDPVATFLAQVHRAPGVERLGSRTGRYRLRTVA